MGGIGPYLPRSHASHFSCALHYQESEVRRTIVLRNELGNIVGIAGHFNGASKPLALSVLLGIVRRRFNMAYASFF
jgi:predicted Zn-dependent protease